MKTLLARWRALRDRDHSGESGASITGLVVVLFAGIIAVTGLAIDGGQHIRGNTRAERVAMEAARAGLQYYRVSGSADPQTAVTAAVNYLETADTDGSLTGTAELDGPNHLTVRVTVTTNTVFLSIIGKNTLESTGRGDADLARLAEGT